MKTNKEWAEYFRQRSEAYEEAAARKGREGQYLEALRMEHLSDAYANVAMTFMQEPS